MKKPIVLLALVLLVLPSISFAAVGVGVGTGKIELDEPLKPGLTYHLPPLTVINTGDEASDYSISIEYRTAAPELKPAKEWFAFEPPRFYLEPAQSQIVEIKLNLPIKGVEPGDYFAFLQAQPIRADEPGMATIGVAAAAKLYFTVEPANVFQAIYYKFANWYSQYHPWNTVVLAMILAAALIAVFRKKFKIQIAKR